MTRFKLLYLGWARRALIVSAGTAFLIALGAHQAAAINKDYCISFTDSSGYVLTGIGFVVPSANNCNTWTGFSAQSSHDSPSVGTACTSSDGTTMTLTIETTFPGFGTPYTEQDGIQITISSGSGTDQYTFNFQGTLGSGSAPVTGAACTAGSIP